MRYSVLQHCVVQKSSQPGGKIIEIDLNKDFPLAKICAYEETSASLLNKQDTAIRDHS